MAYEIRSDVVVDGEVSASGSMTAGGSTLIAESTASTSGFGWVIDEDDFSSNSDTKAPTQQSFKAFVEGLPLIPSQAADDSPVVGNVGNWYYQTTDDEWRGISSIAGDVWVQTGNTSIVRKLCGGAGDKYVDMGVIAGITTSNNRTASVEFYNGATFSAGPSVVAATGGPGAAGDERDELMYSGGSNNSGVPLSNFQSYNGVSWVTQPTILQSQLGMSGGGGSPSYYLNFGFSSTSTLTLKFESGAWAVTGAMAAGRTSCGRNASNFAIDGSIASGGQGSGSTYLAACEQYDFGNLIWASTATLNVGRFWHANAGGQGAAVTSGGRAGTSIRRIDDVETGSFITWVVRSNLPSGLEDATACGSTLEHMVSGGIDDTLNTITSSWRYSLSATQSVFSFDTTVV